VHALARIPVPARRVTAAVGSSPASSSGSRRHEPHHDRGTTAERKLLLFVPWR
jgi:hypothetical protein